MKESVSAVVFIQMTGTKTDSGTGGGLVFQEMLAKSLIERGIKVYAITNPSDLYGFQFLGKNRLVARFLKSSSGAVGLFIFERKKLKNELRSFASNFPKDTLFVTIDPFPPDIFAAKVLRRCGRRVVVTMYHITPSPLFHLIRRGPLRSLIAWLISLNALLFIKTANIPFFLDNKRIALELGWKFDKNLLEMPLALPAYVERRTEGTKKYACFVGRLAKNKGIADLIHAWNVVNKQVPEAVLYIIGTDYGNGRYQRMIERYAMQDSIVITGFLDRETKEEIIKECSVLMFPSYEEGWALAVMEAIDMGLLPVIYELPAYDYICADSIKVKISDIQSLASKTVYYLTHQKERLDQVERLQHCISSYTMATVTEVWINQVNNYFSET
ncbi:MAG: glycosyltransferase family 4 protein [Thermoplasmatales archaeon]|nr:glycosyltransferase family 4 protein [Thermoplasmatales archaeon]